MSPAEQELQRLAAEENDLAEQMAGKTLELETLNIEVNRFHLERYSVIERLYAELDELEARLAEILAKNNPDDQNAQNLADKARTQANNSKLESGQQKEDGITSSVDKKSPSITQACKKAYRKAAKVLHPDRALDEGRRSLLHDYMARINVAYESGNESEINAILAEHQADPAFVDGEDVASQTKRLILSISKLSNQTKMLSRQIEEIRSKDIYLIFEKVTQAECLGGSPLLDLEAVLREEISNKRREILSLRRMAA